MDAGEVAQGALVSNQTSVEATRPLVHACIVVIVLDTLVVLAKTYSRHGIAKLKFWWDDFWILMGYLLLMPICAMALLIVHYETSFVKEDRVIMGLEQNRVLLKIIFALVQCHFGSYACTRYSILALYLRIFTDRSLRVAIWALIAFISLQWLSFAITGVFQCTPVHRFWDRAVDGTCIDVNQFYRFVTPFNLFVDVVLVILPLATIWRLKATTARKYALTLVFGLIGVAALVASAIRLSVYATHSSVLIAPSFSNMMVFWIVVEPSIYLITACLPAMHHIVAAMVPRVISRWMSAQMSRTGNPKNMDNEYHIELGDGSPTKARVEVVPGEQKTNPDPWLENQGIMVTTDIMIEHVEISQEDRIGRVLGF